MRACRASRSCLACRPCTVGPRCSVLYVLAVMRADCLTHLLLDRPTAKLIAAHAALPPDLQARASAASTRLRLQVSGSAPLPLSVKAAWEAPGGVGGGQVLVERYGMTEIGVALSTGFEVEKRVGVRGDWRGGKWRRRWWLMRGR